MTGRHEKHTLSLANTVQNRCFFSLEKHTGYYPFIALSCITERAGEILVYTEVFLKQKYSKHLTSFCLMKTFV